MNTKRIVSLFAAGALVLGTLAGCGGAATQPAGSGQTDTQPAATEAKADTAAADTPAADAGSGEAMMIEVYDAAANYQGLQTGWFDKVVKDRFNIDLNIIAPQVAGDAIYQTRT
jgi:multiple sugar transport system substrate-binding protein/putative aldouronate transport system substrate-binding protein